MKNIHRQSATKPLDVEMAIGDSPITSVVISELNVVTISYKQGKTRLIQCSLECWKNYRKRNKPPMRPQYEIFL